MNAAMQLTPEQIQFYQREGYLALPPITTPEELVKLRAIYDRLFAERAGRAKGDQFDLGGSDEEGKEAKLPQILGPSKYAPELKETLMWSNAMHIARQLLGPDVQNPFDHAIFKPAKVGPPTPWHQDEAYWDEGYEYNSFSMWIPLQEAKIENGCMWFVPRSHTGEILEHRPINNDPRIHGLEMVQPPSESDAVVCPLPPGGCTVHHNRTMHYTGPNRSDIPRRAYILVFGTPPKLLPQAQDFHWKKMQKTARAERAQAVSESKA